MEPVMKNLADINYWESGYEKYKFSPMPLDYPTVKLIYKYLNTPTGEHPKTIFEIGVYPGRFIYHFGKLGYELNGIDQTQYLPALTEWLKSNNFKTGSFEQADVLTLDKEKKYDVVFSAGFIEHFERFEEMIDLHAKLVKPGGHVYITAPNFGGAVQLKLHSLLDRENLNRHFIPSMDVEKWENVLIKNNFEIIESGYIGGIDFWVDQQKRSAGQKLLLSLTKKIVKLLRRINLPNNRAYSPECIIIAKKKF
jgi:2-polyprenyl-3-methyl-5-hydroxy-6-metoxy-1,4-benzoquinol methylase